MQFSKAIVRKPGNSYCNGITTSDLGKPDVKIARIQHEAYCKVLERCGLTIDILDPVEAFPDSVFVEDTAIITEKFALIARPGDKRRLGEEKLIEGKISKYRSLEYILDPGTVDGGDICQAGDHFFIGISKRTNKKGALQLENILKKYGYTSSFIKVNHTLHLKSGFNIIDEEHFLIHRQFSDHPAIKNAKRTIVPDNELYAANVIRLNNYLLVPKGFPGTLKKLKILNPEIITIDMSEFRKTDGGLSCLSLRF